MRVVEFLGHRDGVVEYGLPLRRDIARAIRAHRPDTLVAMTARERFAGGGVNQADHRAVGLAALDAAKDAGNRWIFPELVEEGFAPWGGIRRVLYVGSTEATHGVDVEGFVDASVASLRAHTAYLAGLSGDFPAPEDFLPMMAAGGGVALGVESAVLFAVYDL